MEWWIRSYKGKEKKKEEASKIKDGEFIPKQYFEPHREPYGEIEQKAKSYERLLLYFFAGLIVCILIW